MILVLEILLAKIYHHELSSSHRICKKISCSVEAHFYNHFEISSRITVKIRIFKGLLSAYLRKWRSSNRLSEDS